MHQTIEDVYVCGDIDVQYDIVVSNNVLNDAGKKGSFNENENQKDVR